MYPPHRRPYVPTEPKAWFKPASTNYSSFPRRTDVGFAITCSPAGFLSCRKALQPRSARAMHTPLPAWGQQDHTLSFCPPPAASQAPHSPRSAPGEKILLCSMEKYYSGKSVGVLRSYLPSGLPAPLRTKTCCAQPDSPLATTGARSKP